MGIQNPGVVLNLSQGEIFKPKTMSWVDIHQRKEHLARSSTTENKKQD